MHVELATAIVDFDPFGCPLHPRCLFQPAIEIVLWLREQLRWGSASQGAILTSSIPRASTLALPRVWESRNVNSLHVPRGRTKLCPSR